MTHSTAPARPRILVAPLDWGLGHATRCIPVINALQAAGAEVILAGEGAVKALLQAEFPELRFLHLPGYRVRYGNSRFALAILRQVPRILRTIAKEQQWLRETVRTEHIDAVVSDNRYGLYGVDCPAVIITHQLSVRSGFGPIADALLRRLNYRMLQRFNGCWVPDAANEPNLAGALAHPPLLPAVPTRYTGILSRFCMTNKTEGTMLLVLLSGPEPQRSLLEAELFPQLKKYGGKAIVVRGLPGEKSLPAAPPHITLYNHLPADGLQALLEAASVVVCRSGYSTLMDLSRLRKQCILIPTPGQTEQEYLAEKAAKEGWAISVVQGRLNLARALDTVRQKNTRMPAFETGNALEAAVTALLNPIIARKEAGQPA
jgi:UDP:flavonoid glycosyltransferase YjiC (YdhE family)